MLKKLELIRTPMVLIALIIHFINYRYLSIESYHTALLVCTLMAQVLALVISFVAYLNASKEGYQKEAKIWIYSSLWQLLAMLGVVIYITKQVFYPDFFAESEIAKNSFFLAWFVPVVWSLFLAIGVESSMRVTGRAHTTDEKYVLYRGKSWLSVGILFTSLVLINYSANRLDRAYDWSYLKTTEPGDATKSLLSTLEQDVDVVAFFSRKSEVKPFVKEYLEKISKINTRIKVRFEDKDFSPQLAEKFRASENGQIIMFLNDRRQRVSIGDDLERARKNLRKLDELFLKDFFSLLQDKKVVYFIQGHGEMSWIGSDQNPARSLVLYEKMFRLLNFRVRTLPLTTGRFSEVPSDADLLVIAGPALDYSDSDIRLLSDYVERGGKLLAYLDIEFGGEAEDLLEQSWRLDDWIESLGVSFRREQLADAKRFLRLNRQKSDRAFLATNNFSSHQAVKVLSENERKMGLIVNRAGYFEIADKGQDDPSNKWKVTPIVKTYSTSFNDKNSNYEKDDSENASDYPIGVAAEYDKSRVVLFSDATQISDPLVSNPGNQLAVLSVVKWLTGDDTWTAGIESEEDIKILHSRKEDIFLFYGSITMIPILILGIGFLTNFRRKGN